jgi:F-type H+-transporting ATPase subunit a
MNEFLNSLPAETYTSIFVVIMISTLSILVSIKAKKVDPFKKPKGFMLIAETFVSIISKLVRTNMGSHNKGYIPYFMAITLYVFISFLFGLTGLSSPLSYYMNIFVIVFMSFFLIHFTAIKTNGLRYFHRFIEPFAVFLPINLVSFWVPIVSMSFRIFGNILTGFILMSLVYYTLGELSSIIFFFLPDGFNSIFIAPLIAPWLHLYFDVFSAYIQTLVFISLSMLFIAQEGPARPTKSNEENIIDAFIA